jgi:hypothetical protein
MSEDAKKLVQRWFEEVWNKKREEAITEMSRRGEKRTVYLSRTL